MVKQRQLHGTADSKSDLRKSYRPEKNLNDNSKIMNFSIEKLMREQEND